MRLLLDAHLSGARVGEPLRARGHDVRAADQERELDGWPDEALLALASEEDRILVTFDVKDFPDIARRWVEWLPNAPPRTPVGGGHTLRGGVLGKPNSAHYSASLRPGLARSGARQSHTSEHETATEAERAHAGLAIVVGIDHGEFGAILGVLEGLLEDHADPGAWSDCTYFVSRASPEP